MKKNRTPNAFQSSREASERVRVTRRGRDLGFAGGTHKFTSRLFRDLHS
jgi:hypothetical protein